MPSARRWEVEGRFGSKLTCRHLIAMSALSPKADMCSATSACPLCANSGHRDLINHRGREQRLRNGQAERFCGLEIDDQFDFRQ